MTLSRSRNRSRKRTSDSLQYCRNTIGTSYILYIPKRQMALESSVLEAMLSNPNFWARLLTSNQIAFTILYVLPFYISPTTRPSPTLSRDAPSVIRARIRSVTISIVTCSLITIYVLSSYTHASLLEILHLLGWYPISISDIVRVFFLTALLFTGPLFERGIVDSGWKDWIRGRRVHETLSSWIGWRNYVAVRLPNFPQI